jgi:hypothetical protein
MRRRKALAAMAFVAMVSLPVGNAGAFDESKYPNWKGQWMRADTGAPPRPVYQVGGKRHRSARV